MRFGAKRFVRGTSGQSLVEFALILPMMLVVMFMITEFGRALFQYNILTTATRAGVRQAVVSSDATWQAQADSVANKILSDGHIPPNSVTFTHLDYPNYNGSGYRVVGLQLEKPFNWAFKGPITMQGNATVTKPGGFNLTAVTYMKTETFN